MASWVTHLIIADGLLERFSQLHRRGFCVGNIAPDCNIENEDWTAFTPSREITHWMQGEKKQTSDGDLFCEEYILKRQTCISSDEEYAFLIGYYVHLITDAAYQSMIRNEDRVRAVWHRIRQNRIVRTIHGNGDDMGFGQNPPPESSDDKRNPHAGSGVFESSSGIRISHRNSAAGAVSRLYRLSSEGKYCP